VALPALRSTLAPTASQNSASEAAKLPCGRPFFGGGEEPKIANKAQKRYKFGTCHPYNMLNQRGLLVSPKQEGTDKTPFFGARARSVASLARGPSNRCGGAGSAGKGEWS
jgi:hypothetical protein